MQDAGKEAGGIVWVAKFVLKMGQSKIWNASYQLEVSCASCFSFGLKKEKSWKEVLEEGVNGKNNLGTDSSVLSEFKLLKNYSPV